MIEAEYARNVLIILLGLVKFVRMLRIKFNQLNISIVKPRLYEA